MTRFTIVLTAIVLAALATSACGEEWKRERKIEGMKWQCSTLCSARGGVSDFLRKTLTCKCYIEKGTIDNVSEDILHKNAEIFGMNMKIVKKINGPKRVARQADDSTQIQDSTADKFISITNKTVIPHAKPEEPTRKLPPAPGVLTRLKDNKGSTRIPNRNRNTPVTTVKTMTSSEETVTSPKIPETSPVAAIEAEVTTVQPETITTSGDQVLGQARGIFPNLYRNVGHTKLTAIPSFLPRMAAPTKTFLDDKYIIPEGHKIALEAAARQLSSLLSKVKAKTVDHLTFMAEIQAVKTTLRTLDGFDVKSRSRAAERAFEEIREREKERMQRFRELANRSKLSFGRSPLVGAIHSVDNNKTLSVVPINSEATTVRTA